MRPEVLVIASIGLVLISATVMVSPFTWTERIPRASRSTALVGGVCGLAISQGLGLWIVAFSRMGHTTIAAWWWVGGGVLLLGIMMLTHGLIRHNTVAVFVGVIAVIVGCLWS